MKYEALDLFHFLKNSKSTMLTQLHEFCEINSGSENLAGLATLHQHLSLAFQPLADEITAYPLLPFNSMDMQGKTVNQPCADALFIRKRPELSRRILLSGHMDTVYPSHHPFQKLTYINDNCINGPGVADMKGGLIVILHALTAFEYTPQAKELGWDVFINSEEELGSPSSGEVLANLAPSYQAALVYEPSMAGGKFAKNRRGSGKLTLIATGKAAHVGRAFEEGRNAIYHLTQALTAIHELNGKKEGLTVNIGKIAGGTALNMVPEKAVAKIDVRFQEAKDTDWIIEKINEIIKKLTKEGYRLELHHHFGRPVKRINPPTEKLFARLSLVGKKLGLTVDWEDSGGCCDGNNLASKGLAVIDSLGVRGGHIHSSEEFILVDSMVERSILSALLLSDLADSGLETLQT